MSGGGKDYVYDHNEKTEKENSRKGNICTFKYNPIILRVQKVNFYI